MKIYEKGLIDAPREEVWPYVSEPYLMAKWNKKLVAINRDKDGQVIAGEKFKVRYRMTGKETETEITVTHCQPPQSVEYHHRIFDQNKSCEVTESYELSVVDGKTLFQQAVDISQAIPWWAKPIVWFLNRFGTSRGKESFEQIAELIEQEATDSKSQRN